MSREVSQGRSSVPARERVKYEMSVPSGVAKKLEIRSPEEAFLGVPASPMC